MMSRHCSVLVTGGEGFIGSHLTQRLVTMGYKVRVLVLYNSFGNKGWLDSLSPELLSSLDIRVGDIRDSSLCDEIMKDIDVVFHLAALIAIPYSYVAPQSYIDTNIHGTLNILQAARKEGIDLLVHTSTSEVYGSAQYVPINESHPLQAQSPYAASKIAADQLVLSFNKSFGLPASIIRPFNTYGPRQSSRAVIPNIIKQLCVGNNVKLGALEPTRDFNYIDDTVSGFISFLLSPQEQVFGEVINIGSGFEVSISDLALLIAKIMNVEIDLIPDSSRLRPEKSEVDRLLACNQKAKTLLGWQPKFSGLDGLSHGLKNTITWFRDDHNLSFYNPSEYTL